MQKPIRVRTVPPLLAEHVAQLQSRGYTRKEVEHMMVSEVHVDQDDALVAIESAGPWPRAVRRGRQ